ncbi:PadR family transcriptional regulator, partial [Staphylococcus xylosus]
VTSISKKSDTGGPKRKYYSITTEGKEELANFIYKWNYLNNGMNNLMRSVYDVE